jgi:fermentation-respiration switch protein FrsA (DUF1100 family)
MDEAVYRIVVDRVSQAGLSDDVGLLVLAACEGQDQLDAVLGGEPMPRPRAGEDTGEGEPVGAYLGSVRVEGFRGIGPRRPSDSRPDPVSPWWWAATALASRASRRRWNSSSRGTAGGGANRGRRSGGKAGATSTTQGRRDYLPT